MAAKGVWEIVALILVGIGFFLYGMEIVAGAIKLLSGHQTRRLLSRWTGNTWLGMAFGFVSGAVSQSGSKASLIMANLMASRLISLKSAIPIVAAANLGTVLIVFLVSVDIKLATLYFLALFLFLFTFSHSSGRKPLTGAFLGIGLLLFGFITLQSGAKPLLAIPAVAALPEHLGGAAYFAWLPFLLGILLRFIAQSTSAVIVIAVTFLHAGGLDFDQAMFLTFGAIAGSGLNTWLMGAKLKGSARQLALFQMTYDAASSLVMTALVLVEIAGHIPMLKALIGSLSGDVNRQLAYVYLASRGVGFFLSLAFRNHIVAFLEKISPPSVGERLSQPQFLYDEAAEDPYSAVPLLEKEQVRLVRRLPMYLEELRQEHEEGAIHSRAELHPATRELGTEIRSFLGAVMREDMPRETTELLLRLQNRQDFLMLAEESLNSFTEEVAAWQPQGPLAATRLGLVESLHAVLSVAADTAASAAPDEVAELLAMTDDKSPLMQRLREGGLSGETALSAESRAAFLHVTDLYQRIVWMLHQWAQTLRTA